MEGLRENLMKVWVYFKRGHSAWFAFLIALFNFATIQYKLLIKNISFFAVFFPRFAIFLVVFLLTYPPVAILLGRYDYKKKLALKTEIELSPYFEDLLPKERIEWEVLLELIKILKDIAEKEGVCTKSLEKVAKKLEDYLNRSSLGKELAMC